MFKSDLHTHTILSGHAISTLQELVCAANLKRIELLGVTEHGPGMIGGVNNSYFGVVDRIPSFIDGVRVLKGVEANILDGDGLLDVPSWAIPKLDYVIAGLHLDCGFKDGGEKINTNAILNSIKHNSSIKILSHLYSPYFKINIEEVTKVAIKHGILLEINASFFNNKLIDNHNVYDDFKKMIEILKSYGQKMLLSSDAHSSFEVGNFDNVVERLDEFGLVLDDFINNDIRSILKFLDIKF